MSGKFKYDKEDNLLIEQPEEGTKFYDYQNSFLRRVAVSEGLKRHIMSVPLYTKVEFEIEKDFLIKTEGSCGSGGLLQTAIPIPNNADPKYSTQAINELIERDKVDTNLISDGYHTFGELYQHRNILFIALCKQIYNESLENGIADDGIGVYRTRFDFENKYCGDGWFIMGVGTQKGKQISYHLPFNLWDECKFANNIEKVPAFDGHNSKDVIDRLLKNFIR